jgi:hypothetical protein
VFLSLSGIKKCERGVFFITGFSDTLLCVVGELKILLVKSNKTDLGFCVECVTQRKKEEV